MRHLHTILILAVGLAFLFVACESNLFEPDSAEQDVADPHAQSEVLALETNKLKITARHPVGNQSANHPHAIGDEAHYEFVLSKNEIEAGWTTIQFRNQTSTLHFANVQRLSDYAVQDLEGNYEGETLAEKWIDSGSGYQDGLTEYYLGDRTLSQYFAAWGKTPEWFPDLTGEHWRPSGGPGMLGGLLTSHTTTYLEPGTYIIDCYVLADDGKGSMHIAHGMVETLVVTEGSSDTVEPEASLDLTVSAEGIAFEEENVAPGRHTVRFSVEPGNHNVHLIRLDEGQSAEEVSQWMNYHDPVWDAEKEAWVYGDNGAFVSSHDDPGPQTFLGGMHNMLVQEGEETAYHHVTLRPGKYAWVNVYYFLQEGSWHEFTVSPPGRAGR